MSESDSTPTNSRSTTSRSTRKGKSSAQNQSQKRPIAKSKLRSPLWEQQPDEPDRWFLRFDSFRAMGLGVRSLLGAVRAEEVENGKEKISKSPPGAWVNASRYWRWHERAGAWDKDQNKKKNKQKAAAREKRNFEAEDVLNAWVAIATSDITDYFDFSLVNRIISAHDPTEFERAIADKPELFITLKKLDELPPEKRRAVLEMSIETTKDGQRTRLKLQPKTPALQALSQYYGLLTDSNVAFETLKRFGFKVRPREYGYQLFDTFSEAGKREAEKDEELENDQDDSPPEQGPVFNDSSGDDA